MSIIQVSKLSGYSIATVSRVINRHPNVTPVTAQAVEAAIRQLSYVPPTEKRVGRPRRTTAPQSLTSPVHSNPTDQRTNSIALLFHDTRQSALKTNLSIRLLHGIEDALWRRSAAMTLLRLPESGLLPAQINPRQVDGVIIRTLNRYKSLDLTAIGSLPCVHLFERSESPSHGDMIFEDNQAIGTMAVNHLKSQGCRKLIFILPLIEHPSFQARMQAFVAGAQQQGCTVKVLDPPAKLDVMNLAQIDLWNTPELLQQRIDKWVSQIQDLSAECDGLFMPGSDPEIELLLKKLLQNNPGLDQRLKMVVCHNQTAAIHALSPNVDVIDIQPEEMGAAAVDTVYWRMDNPTAARRRLLIEPALITAPVNAQTFAA